ncbi:MAG TPA: hypothetical protein VJI68_00010 [Candidatus Nanoarchaeia archaeon]|nr:hypothetical protein [Candidatus Nanoarchaeia archaeon]
MALDFQYLLSYLVDIGVIDVFLPFLLVFAIIFAILEKTHILGAEKTNINVVVSLAIGLLLVVQRDIVEIINTFLPRVSLIIVVVLMMLLLIALVSGQPFKGFQNGLLGLAMIILVVAVLIALFVPPGSYYGGFYFTQRDLDILLTQVLPILGAIVVFYLIVRKNKPDDQHNPNKKSVLEFLSGGLKDK